MEIFNRYMNEIKADDSLKSNTKNYVLNRMVQLQNPYKNIGRERIQMEKKDFTGRRKIIIAACAVMAIALLSVGGFIYYKTPVNYVSLDINPSVEIALNRFDQVVAVKAENSDGEALLKNRNVTNLSLEAAVNSLVQEAADQGFIQEDGSSVIALTSESKDAQKALELQEKSTNGVNMAIQEKKAFVAVYSDCSDLQLRNEAKEMGISPGKYKMIKMLQTMDPSITVEQYQNAKVSEIMTKAAEMVQDKNMGETQNEELARFTQRVQNVTQAMNQNKEKAAEQQKRRETENNNNQGTTQNREQETNQNTTAPGQTNGNGQQGGATPTASNGQQGGATPTAGSGQQGGATSTASNGQQGGATSTASNGQQGGATQTAGSGQQGGTTPTADSGQQGGATQTAGSGQQGGATSTAGSGNGNH